MQAIMVLNDGETFTSLDGCAIWVISEADAIRLDEGCDPKDITPHARYVMGATHEAGGNVVYA